MREFQSHQSDSVTCRQCGHTTAMPRGLLTEDQKRHFLCEACLGSPVVENQVQHRQDHSGGRKVLTEDLPNID